MWNSFLGLGYSLVFACMLADGCIASVQRPSLWEIEDTIARNCGKALSFTSGLRFFEWSYPSNIVRVHQTVLGSIDCVELEVETGVLIYIVCPSGWTHERQFTLLTDGLRQQIGFVPVLDVEKVIPFTGGDFLLVSNGIVKSNYVQLTKDGVHFEASEEP